MGQYDGTGGLALTTQLIAFCRLISREDNLPGIKAHLARFKIVLVNRNVRAGEVTLAQYDDFVRGRTDIDYVMIASAMKAGVNSVIRIASRHSRRQPAKNVPNRDPQPANTRLPARFPARR